MKIGAMNHPKKDVLAEIERIGRAKFDFVDLTLEPPAAATWQVDVEAVRRVLDRWNLDVVVHTAYYIPLATPFAGLRQAALREFTEAATVAHRLGARLLTVHFTQPPPFFDEPDIVAWCLEVLAPLCERAGRSGVRVALENSPKGGPRQLEIFEQLLEQLPGLGLQLDSGHAKLEAATDRWAEYLERLGRRLVHVHLSDNDGSSDQHLPLGSVPSGGIDWPEHIRLLKQTGFNRTVTLEVFSPRLRYLLTSRDYLLKLWREVKPSPNPEA